MKSLGSRQTTGPEAILMVVIKLWFQQHQSILKPNIERILKANPTDFVSKNDRDLGLALGKHVSLETMVSHLWNYSKNDMILKFMIEQAVVAQRSTNFKDKIQMSKDFCLKHLTSELGLFIKFECKPF